MNERKNHQLRFAPLIRVSTEKQGTKGESLSTQKKQNTASVKQLGGTIPKSCWEYSGQEHATPDDRGHTDVRRQMTEVRGQKSCLSSLS